MFMASRDYMKQIFVQLSLKSCMNFYENKKKDQIRCQEKPLGYIVDITVPQTNSGG